MSFLNPLGLIGLIGVPILIIIYILRSKYNEQTVASTYLWTLSEKFFKRRNPLSGLTGLISLILQLLTVVIISMALARPVFVVPDSASEYCFILDGSGSMNTDSDGKSCFERGKEYIEDSIDSARLGSTYTLIFVNSDTAVIYERISDKDTAKDLLADLQCSDGPSDYDDAISTAQAYFDENSSALVYLVTDKSCNSSENIEIVNVSSQKTVNYGINDPWATLTDGTLYTGATVTSYTSDATVEVMLYVNGSEKAAKKTTISLSAGESGEVELSCKATSYDSIRLVITNKDDLAADNEVMSYNVSNDESYKILIVSKTPFFFEAAFDSLTDSVVDTVDPDEYKGQGGYGLYVFHSYTPDVLPDAAVWLVNSTKSVDKSGFGIRGIIGLDAPGELTKSRSTASQAKKLLAGVEGRDIYISEYVKYSGMYTQFTTIFSYDSNPMIMAGVNALGNREVVFAFDIHNSDIALSTDFAPLMSNLLDYSCPALIEKSDYLCGEDVNINITANIDSVKVISPTGAESYIDTSTDIGVLSLNRVGTYTLVFSVAGEQKTYKIYAASPISESDPTETLAELSLAGEQTYEKTDGLYDPLVLLFIMLAIVFTADWMVYCYEKYQLR